MKILVIGSPNTIETELLVKEAERKGHFVKTIKSNEFDFILRKGKFIAKNENITPENFDAFIVRGISKKYVFNNTEFNISTEAMLFLKYIKNSGKKIFVDEKLIIQPQIASKMSTALDLALADISYPNTWQFQSFDALIKNLNELSFPIIVKDPTGRKGENIYKFDSQEEMIKSIKEIAGESEYLPYLFQEYLPCDGDIRVFVVGYKAIGAMKRFKIRNDFRSNISQGAEAEIYQLNEKLTSIAEKAAKVTKTEIAGVDIIESNGKYYVIEVNRAPQFKGFYQYTKINPAEAIIEYIEQKFKND